MENKISRLKNQYGDGLVTTSDVNYYLPGTIQQTQEASPVAPLENISSETALRSDSFLENFGTDFWASATVSGFGQTVASIADVVRPSTQQEGYNPFKDEAYTSKDDDFKARFGNNFLLSKNAEDTKRLLDRYNNLTEAESLFANPNIDMHNSAVVLGMLTGAVVDPTTVLPVVGLTAKIGTAAKTASVISSMAGASLLRDTLGNRALELTSGEIRTNAAIAGIFGIALTGGMFLGKGVRANKVDVDKWLQSKVDSTAGAAQKIKAADTTLQNDTGNWFTDFLFRNVEEKILLPLSPKGRMITSKFDSVREAGNKLIDNVFEMKGTKIRDNVVASAEIDGSELRTLHDEWADDFSNYLSNSGKADDLTYKEALTETLLRSSDEGQFSFGPKAKQLIKSDPELGKAIKATADRHGKIVTRFLDKAQAAGMLKDVPKNKFYVPFHFNARKVSASRELFVDDIAKAFKEQDIRKGNKVLDDDYYKGNAEQFSDEIIQRNITDQRSVVKFPARKGFTKERTFDLDRSQFSSWIESDYDVLMRKYIRDGVPQIHMNRIFGDDYGQTAVNKMQDEIQVAIDKVRKSDLPEVKKNKAIDKLQSDFESSKADFQGMVNRLYGRRADGGSTYSAWRGVGDVIKSLTNVRFMSNLLLSQFPDMAQVVDQLASTKMGGIAKDTAEFAGEHLGKMSKKQREMVGVYNRVVNEQRYKHLWAETDTSLNAESYLAKKLSGFASKANSYIFTISGSQPMNNLTKMLVSEDLVDNVIKLAKKAKKGSKLSDDSIAYLDELNISKQDLDTILEDWSATAKKEGTTYWADLDSMNTNSSMKLKKAIRKVADETIIAPDIGNKPLFFDNPFAIFLGQYKGFTLAAMEKYAGKDLQQGGRGLSRVVARTIAGSMVYLAKQSSRKDWDDIEKDPATLIVEGIHRGGSFAGFDLLSDTADMTFGMGLSGILKTDRAQRRFYNGNTSLLQQSWGPASVVMIDIQRAVEKVKRGEADEATLTLLKNYSGFMNAFYTQILLNKLIEEDK